MLRTFYVLSLMLIEFILHKGQYNKHICSKNLKKYNFVGKKHRILASIIEDREKQVEDITDGYKPIFNIYEISAAFHKKKDIADKKKRRRYGNQQSIENRRIAEENERRLSNQLDDIQFIELSNKYPNIGKQNSQQNKVNKINNQNGASNSNDNIRNDEDEDEGEDEDEDDDLIEGRKDNLEEDDLVEKNGANLKRGNMHGQEEKNKNINTTPGNENNSKNVNDNKKSGISLKDKIDNNEQHNSGLKGTTKYLDDNIKTYTFDHYKLITNSDNILNDIKVDASDISKLSINSLSIEYNEVNKTEYTHQRHIVLTNKGNRRYKIFLMTKNPKFTKTEDIEEPEMSFIQTETGENTNEKEDEENYLNENLYSGFGTIDYENGYSKKKKKINSEHASELNDKISNSQNIEKSDSHENEKYNHGFIGKIQSFFSFLSIPSSKKDDSIGSEKKSEERNNVDSKPKLNKKPNDTAKKNNSNKILTVDKVTDQYLLNLKNKNMKEQELIFIFHGDLDLHSKKMKTIINEANVKFTKYINMHFKDVKNIRYDISSPINFVCFFIPIIFDMSNLKILKEALIILHNELKNYIDNWNFSNTYIAFDTDYENEDIDNAMNKLNENMKKYIKKPKKLYNIKYSFLRKMWGLESIFSLSKNRNQKNAGIEEKILNALPKELKEYSTWNLSFIRVFNAWLLSGYGNKNVKICVIDSGVDKNHIDLAKNIYTPKYSDRYEMTDDFFDFMVKNPIDTSGHGTHVSGIAAASANSLGMVGVAPDVNLISLRFIDGDSYGGSFHVIKAINVCILNKSPIINASWGSRNYDTNMFLAIERLKYTFKGKGTVFIAAAGNENKNNDLYPIYPASYKLPNVYSVGSINKFLQISPFSNYGANSVHILAPGHHIYSTTPMNTYKMNTGTSMAAPHVSGVAGLIYSVCHKQGFIPESDEVLDIITRTSIKIVSKDKKTIHNSLINAEAAVLTTLLGGLWMQMDCHFAKFYLNKDQQKNIPVVFSAYKDGMYESDIIIGIQPEDSNSKEYGEIVIPIKILTNPKLKNFNLSPRVGKKIHIDANESNDDILSYICENALYNLYEHDNSFLISSLILFFIGIILIALASIVFFLKHHQSKQRDAEKYMHQKMVDRAHGIKYNFKDAGADGIKRINTMDDNINNHRNTQRFTIVQNEDNMYVLKKKSSIQAKYEPRNELVKRPLVKRPIVKHADINVNFKNIDELYEPQNNSPE
ncbi:subtilisin-like protease 2, putative [Plasmodium yoelii]|uniref:subtilisin n=3 Tax=Plasmodium yoelii TaxID=5861 RepID=A0AAF0B2A9_PLAYO|nr:subtilisin-like protease 2, putative [Plasmodium yoelii]EAA20512.1 subtilisin-like protease 2 [Plasmodium yoelii yoelii]WBY57223.1 subtilisin-like protease 2 [Plasmodium yoelii yoelii]CDU17906.1 subtilisin-like protease 2 [Plasmodium yoelii]VTZ78323.1 subtilisin-like protease 2, putative [Plasmodium yoelii]|eukprot:XP_728947.1 subtilisin-like protease 2, putative [Plasmodium yoelii]